MNFLTSIVRRELRKPTDAINVLVLVNEFKEKEDLENSSIFFFNSIKPHIEYDVVVSDEINLEAASQFAIANHLFLLKSDALDKSDLENILRQFAKQPYLEHPYS